MVKKIGNILTTSNIEYPEYFNVSDTLDFSNDLPTLIVGFKVTLELFRDRINGKDNSLGDNLYWTFTNTENRSKYEGQLESFTNTCLLYITKDTHYIFVDLIHYKPKKLFSIAKKILSLDNPISLIYKDMVYIYGENLIFGIDLYLCNFVGLNSDKILNKIKNISEDTLEYDMIIIEYKDFLLKVDNEVKYLPILYSIQNGKS